MVIFLICVFHLLCVDFCDVLEGRLDMNEFPVVSSLCLGKYFWDYQLARKKCLMKGCFEVQRNNFGERFRNRFG